MPDDDRLDLEFAYTSFQDSCRDLHSLVYRCPECHPLTTAPAA